MGAGQPRTPAAANISEAIARVRTIADDRQRVEAINQIWLILVKDSSSVTPNDVLALAALMGDPDDSVRHDAALALGAIGPRAAAAIPALQAALPSVECVWASHNSAPAIRYALRQIGVEPPRIDCPPADLSLPPRPATRPSGN